MEEPILASTLPTAYRLITSLCLVVGAGLITAQTTRSVWDGVYTSEQAQRGSTLYANSCASCHGSALGGGFLSVQLFARSAENGRATASTLSDVWHFLLGALVGGVAGAGLVIVVIAVLWPGVFSKDDPTSGSARNWGP